MTSRARPAVPPGRIYALADAEALGSTPLPEAVSALAGAGIGWIQVRAKRLSGSALYRALEGCCRALEGTGAALWVDDRADLAALFPVAGVHVGQTDLPPAAVRCVVGPAAWIGQSTHHEVQCVEADADGAVDVVAVGPVFPTTGKEKPDPVVGLDFVRGVRILTTKLLVAIGGIGGHNLASVLAMGADVVAVLGAVSGKDGAEIEAKARHLLAVAR
ncbi:MAG TPA: thiamine phosphate synthase [Acidobacteria bacterium]|nr:thiamine phosphate synthase [Acidobacteriota bacterium]